MKDTFKLLPQHIIVVSRVFGAFPINPNTFNYSKLNLLNTVCQCVIPFLQSSIFIFIPDGFENDTQYVFVVKLLFHWVISLANINSKYTCSFRYKKHLESVSLEMEASDRILRTMYSFNPNRTVCLLSLLALAAFGGAMVPVYLARLTTLALNNVDLTRIVFFAFMYWQNLTVCCVELQFISIVTNLYFQFHQINAVLENLLARIDGIKQAHLRCVFGQKEFLTCDEKNAKNTQHTRLGYYSYSSNFRTYKNMPRRNDVNGSIDFSLELLNLREAHLHLSKALYLLNKLFGVQLFLSLSLCFCCTLLDITYERFGYFNSRVGTLRFAIVIWVVGYSLRFVLVVLSASRTGYKAKYAGSLVTCMANRFLSVDTKEELMLFYKHVLCFDFEFSASGFFTLNMGLVTSAIAAGTTYLVILFQFQPRAE